MNTRQQQELELERLMKLALSEAGHRPAFYRALLMADVYVLGDANDETDGEVELEEGSQVQLQQWQTDDGAVFIPFFSSIKRLREAIDSEQTYMLLPARALFEITSGADLYLNPADDDGRLFSADEITELLNEQPRTVAKSRIFDVDSRVNVSEPQPYPATLVDALTQLFPQYSMVKSAYLLSISAVGVNEPAHLLVGIEVSNEDTEQLFADIGRIAEDTLDAEQVLDIFAIGEDLTGLNGYLLTQCQPFYRYEWGHKIRPSLGEGHA